MKVGVGIGVIIGILLAVVAYLVDAVNLYGMISLMFLLVGLWILVSAFINVDPKDRFYYTSWGVIIAFLALFYFIPPNYTIALIILAIIALIITNVYTRRPPKISTAANSPAQALGSTPASEG